jgi:hypothetical protein
MARIAEGGGPIQTRPASARLGEVGVLGQEAVAGVDGLGSHLLGGARIFSGTR